MKTLVQIASRTIGTGQPTLVIAEAAQAHDGSLGQAHAFIDAVAMAGADVIKFQTHIAHAESTLDEKFRVPFSYEDKTRYDYWERMEFNSEQWSELAKHAEERGVIFLSSPFSLEAAKLLQDINVPAWKIGSGELMNPELLNFVIDTQKPVLLSSGMSTWSEISHVVDFFRNKGCPVAVFQCTSSYTVKLSQVGLNIISEIESRFGIPAGLSDHSGTIFPSLAAMALGASLIEVHVVFHRKMFGPDTAASITLDDLAFLVQARDAFWEMQASVDKDNMANNLREMREMFGRSLALRMDLPSGTILEKHHLTLKKPGNGISYTYINKVIGIKLKKAVSSKRILRWEDLGGKIE